MRTGTGNFVNFTKACDYYRAQGNDELTPAELEKLVREKINEGEILLGKPDMPVGARLLLIDNNTRYSIEDGDVDNPAPRNDLAHAHLSDKELIRLIDESKK